MVASRQYLEPGQRVLASAPNLEMPLWGLTLYHPLFSTPDNSYWIVNRPAEMVITLEDTTEQTYEPAYFEITLPKLDGQGQQDLQVTLQNVDRVITDELELANSDPSERIQVTLRLFIESDLTAGPQNTPLRLSFVSVAASSQSVTGTAGRPDVLNRAFPAEVYRIDRYPGLDR